MYHKTDFYIFGMERFFGSRIEYVLNSAKYPDFEGAVFASKIHNFRAFLLNLALTKQKILKDGIVHDAQ
ncbi:hypothetical protein SUBVAR_05388 [Subdoligranulum variabile DSM 15176]|uniref:Uncharacterized protein n=1 Tax=Subdoligranulum variabile DSM 15176 TaxID=411471 RepID=D1PM31_9FIRM|nr:hypothetical protein SUBVAR_05388 [Subdoligranulum variabile DSM 15176]